MSHLKNQKGFTGFEIILAVVALVAIGAAGYYAYQARSAQSADYSVNVLHKKTTASQPASPAPIQKADTAAAEQVVQQFYSAYTKAAQTGPQSAYQSVVAQYGTPNFIKVYPTANGFDPVFCGQNMPDQGITVLSSTAKDASTVTVNISQNYSGGGGSVKSSATVVGGKIDAVTCPAP